MVSAQAFDQLVQRAQQDPAVVGLILTGSRARPGLATERSDYDVYVITDGDPAWPSTRSPGLDEEVIPLAEFGRYALPGHPHEWNRYSFTWARVLLDRQDGEITRLTRAKGTLRPAEARRLAAGALDAYVNAAYRSAKNHRDARPTEAHLDAAESLPHLLTTLFALHRRVRPYNKYLGWELREHPLGGSGWTADRLLPRLRHVLATGDPPTQRALFADLTAQARTAGLALVLDAWGPDLDLLT
ncbi:MAG TPA: hypothetical protein VH089_07145 [Streptosporangiaceae bacterium]|nr:hypothetical protein [Streptosporangiaceae bacterium]